MIKGEEGIPIRRNITGQWPRCMKKRGFPQDLCADQNSYSNVIKVEEVNELSWRDG